MTIRTPRLHTAIGAFLACATALSAQAALATDIYFRSFSASAAIGPPADAYAAKLDGISVTTLGSGGEVRFVKLPGIPPVPSQFGGNIISAVGAGAAGGGFDAAYISGSDLNKAWGFLYNSCIPFGPNFDEFIGFLYGKSIDGQQTGLDLLQSTLDRSGKNLVAIPIVGSSEQLSGYFPLPIGDVPGTKGIGLAGMCQQPWTLRYLPPAQYVLGVACNNLVAAGVIPANNLKFVAAVAGNGSLVDGVKTGQIQGFEFATPLDDLSQLFTGVDNPGTVGVRYVHLPGWQQQFLITYMLINKQVWNALTPAQQTLVQSVARDNLISTFGENFRQQGPSLKFIMDVNRFDGDPSNDMVLVDWPKRDQQLLSAATIQFLNARVNDTTLSAADRADFAVILEALRSYVQTNDLYWDHRQVEPKMRFHGWTNAAGAPWFDKLTHNK
jgi:hypothetical protein